MKQVHAIIRGKVIGVSFRAWTKTQADSLGLLGWVKNVGGHVEAIFQGDEKSINKMFELLRFGPPGSRVEDIKIASDENKDVFNKFEIRKY